MGNEVVHYLTNQDHYRLQVDLEDWAGHTRTATYRHFWVDAEEDSKYDYVCFCPCVAVVHVPSPAPDSNVVRQVYLCVSRDSKYVIVTCVFFWSVCGARTSPERDGEVVFQVYLCEVSHVTVNRLLFFYLCCVVGYLVCLLFNLSNGCISVTNW